MDSFSLTRCLFRQTALVLLAFLSLTVVIFPATAAQAHDVLVGTNPEDGATLSTAPSTIGLTFSNTPIALGAEILVFDGNGTNWADGPVSIVDNQVSQAIRAGAPAGKFTVQWRIVSSDSHPIEGTFSFTSQGPEPDSSQPAPVPTSPPAPAAQPATQSATHPTATTDYNIPWGGLAAGIGVVVVVIVGIAASKRRRSRLKADDETPGN
ncbi:copper resistance CopC family protein [Paeniglutamicibacter kerguelensis]|uniref:Methionine-rich copper-binding protein CopC n=1 Tax=Paeniglutamicibacter kerguelensis TaxID=254788 RepID=A0ABS4XG37_9MICC|nr:copper resistance CopC family protein [Paeniglutamicibacter kerguelensis]MBP2387266.1 methionine-rich copper-binding protein CopC [Paeniglutamicibacter kerguelensis]